ncbi:hypothetical protein PsorP6_000114 [Peronosclerospora sorghi]|uniref:Uncharacterized protein n=1 Tax=Peronosclerospora sorghi TaxID=230839 RepID=A0ACC0WRY0_9STRA|nr:hypothetical protein PsorP6_000114 [Peronosclerospora sorghi]
MLKIEKTWRTSLSYEPYSIACKDHAPTKLLSLNILRNLLTTSTDLQELARCSLLINIDISNKLIDALETLNILKAMPMLKTLRIADNR